MGHPVPIGRPILAQRLALYVMRRSAPLAARVLDVLARFFNAVSGRIGGFLGTIVGLVSLFFRPVGGLFGSFAYGVASLLGCLTDSVTHLFNLALHGFGHDLYSHGLR